MASDESVQLSAGLSRGSEITQCAKKADEGVGRRPGGPPHTDFKMSRNTARLAGHPTFPTSRISAFGAGQVGNLPHGGSCSFYINSEHFRRL